MSRRFQTDNTFCETIDPVGLNRLYILPTSPVTPAILTTIGCFLELRSLFLNYYPNVKYVYMIYARAQYISF